MQEDQRQQRRGPAEPFGKLIVTLIPFEKLERVDIRADVLDISADGLGIIADCALEPAFVVIRDGLKERKNGILVWSKELNTHTYRAGIQFLPVNGKEDLFQKKIPPLPSLSVFQNPETESMQLLAAAVFANTTEGILVTDVTGVIRSVNKAFVYITGYTEAEAIGQNFRIFKSGLQDDGFYAVMWKALRQMGTWKGTFWNRRKNGEIYPQETTINAIRNDRGEIVQYCGIFRDITEQHKLGETLRMLSSTDGLTGLANRRSFDETFLREWRRAQRLDYPVAIIMADIDNFKKFNDTYGHLDGDECLKKVGASLKNAVHRAGDLAARFGGEEFVLLMPMAKIAEAMQIAEGIRQRVQALKIPHETSDTCSFVTLSLGVAAVIPQPDMSPQNLIIMADKAMYQAKHAGKNQVSCAGC